MAIDTGTPQGSVAIPKVRLEVDMATHYEVSQFLTLEARLLDDRKYDDWLALFAEDLHYWMPARYNRMGREMAKENAAPGETANFDDDKATLAQRVVRLDSNKAWSEDPASRTRHLVSNVWVRPTERVDEFEVQSAFVLYRTRMDADPDIWAGRRDDMIRRIEPETWQIARRHILLDQATLKGNISVLF